MNLYLVKQDENTDWDTYDSFVCAAETEDDARNLVPDEFTSFGDSLSSWCSSPDKATVTLIGVAVKNVEEGEILCASFNAG